MECNKIKVSETIAEAITELYGYDNGKTRKRFYEYVKSNNIDISHLKKKKSKYKTIIKECPVCGTEFQTKTGGYKREQHTCSHSCSNTYFRTGYDNGNWKGNDYRNLCFLHHKKECIVCGEDKIVTVHHYDENHNNNEITNLIPLCPTHHQYVHSRYKDEVIDIIDKYRLNFYIPS